MAGFWIGNRVTLWLTYFNNGDGLWLYKVRRCGGIYELAGNLCCRQSECMFVTQNAKICESTDELAIQKHIGHIFCKFVKGND